MSASARVFVCVCFVAGAPSLRGFVNARSIVRSNDSGIFYMIGMHPFSHRPPPSACLPLVLACSTET